MCRAWAAALLLVGVASARAVEEEYRVDGARSSVTVRVARAGALSSFLHDHQLVATRFDGKIARATDDPSSVIVDLTVAADSLREAPGSPLKPEDVRAVEEQLRGPQVLDVARFPQIRFTAWRFAPAERQRVAGSRREKDATSGELQGALTLHGRTREVRVPVAATVSGGELRARGRFVIRQSDFGITPYKKAWGAIAVDDSVRVDFSIVAVRK